MIDQGHIKSDAIKDDPWETPVPVKSQNIPRQLANDDVAETHQLCNLLSVNLKRVAVPIP